MNTCGIVFIFICTFSIGAMENKPLSLKAFIEKNHESYTSLNGVPINDSTLFSLCNKMPENLQLTIDSWAKENTSFLHEAIPLDKNFDLSQMSSQKEKDSFSQLICSRKFVNKSKENAALPISIEKDTWFIKFAGPYRRWFTLKRTTQDWANPDVPPRTYQTASTMAHYQHYKNLLDIEKIKTIELPETYVAQIPERGPIEKTLCDENCFIVQKKLNSLALLKSNPEYIADLPDQSIRDLFRLMIKGPIWDLYCNLGINILSKNLVLFDFEQAKNESGSFFFQKNPEYIKTKITQSILGFLSLICDGLSTYQSYEVQKKYEIFSKELQKFPMLEKADPAIEYKIMHIAELLDENNTGNKKLKAEYYE